MGQQTAVPKHFGTYLNTLLRAHKLSALQLAEAAGLEAGFVGRLLSGEQILTGDVALLVAEVLKSSPLELLEIQRFALLESRELHEVSRFAA